jgi:hypothetical protein
MFDQDHPAHSAPVVDDASAGITFPDHWSNPTAESYIAAFDRDGLLRDLRRSKLTRSQRAVMRVLAKEVRDGDSCLISVPRLAKAVGLKDRQVQYILRQLKAARWLGVAEPKDWQPGRKCPSRYWPRSGDVSCVPSSRRDCKRSSESPQGVHSMGAPGAPEKHYGGLSETPRIKRELESERALASMLMPRQAPTSERHREKNPTVQTRDIAGDIQEAEADDLPEEPMSERSSCPVAPPAPPADPLEGCLDCGEPTQGWDYALCSPCADRGALERALEREIAANTPSEDRRSDR